MWTEFLAAIRQGDVERVRAWLRDDPALLEARDEQGLSGLMWSVYQRHATVTELLLAQPRALDAFEAAAVGDLRTIQRLLAEDPECARRFAGDGFSALGLATFFGHTAVAERLLAAGADPSAPARNLMRVTPLHSALANGDADRARTLARLLIAHGADVNAVQQGGWTALHQAAARGDRDLIEVLLAHGANPQAANADGRTPLDLARSAHHAAAIALLETSQR